MWCRRSDVTFCCLLSVLLIHNTLTESVQLTQCPRSCELSDDIRLSCENRGCTSVPTSEVREAYYAEQIHYRNNLVTNVTVMEKFYNLKYIDLSYNQISHIMDGAFVKQRYMTRLNLGYNKLTILRQEYFHQLNSLLELDLSGNHLEFISDNVFYDTMRALQSLHLSKNRIRSITHNAFTDLPDLKYLHLANNELATLEQADFLGLKELQDLELSGNLFTAIPDGAFRECENLRNLHISNNVIRLIEKGAFRNLDKLQVLDLEKNRLERVTAGMFDGLTSIDTLYLDKNPITSIDSGTLPLSLRKLSLQYQPKLETIKNGTFSGMEQLTTVEITSSKKLTTIESGAFGGVNSTVKTLSLYNNSLTTLSEELVNWSLVYRPVLSENNWNCDCNLAWIKHSSDLADEDKKQVLCRDPMHLRGMSVVDVDFRQFSCAFFTVHKRGIEVSLILCVTILFASIMGSLGYKFRHSLFPCCYIMPGQYRTQYDAVSTDDHDSIKIKFGESTGLNKKSSEKERIIPGPTPV